MPGLLDVIGCRDVVDSILDKCGVMCLARLTLTSKSTREIIDEYNRRTKRIFPVRCGGFDHEHHTFWATYKRERFEEAMKRPAAKLYELATAIELSERERAVLLMSTVHLYHRTGGEFARNCAVAALPPRYTAVES